MVLLLLLEVGVFLNIIKAGLLDFSQGILVVIVLFPDDLTIVSCAILPLNTTLFASLYYSYHSADPLRIIE